MQKYIQDLHNILHALNHNMHSIFPCEHILRQHELSFFFCFFFMFLKCPSWTIRVEVSISLFGTSCFKKSKLPVTGEKWALNTCTGKLTSGDLPRKSVVK